MPEAVPPGLGTLITQSDLDAALENKLSPTDSPSTGDIEGTFDSGLTFAVPVATNAALTAETDARVTAVGDIQAQIGVINAGGVPKLNANNVWTGAQSVSPGNGGVFAIDGVAAAHLNQPVGNTQNGYVVKAPAASWGNATAYGTAQAFMLLREDNDTGENLYGSTNLEPDRNVLFRVDGRTGGLGTGGGGHFAIGLRQHAGFTATQNVWIQSFLDTTSLVVDAGNDTPTAALAQFRLHGGQLLFTISPTGQLGTWSRDAATRGLISIGRNAISEFNIGVEGTALGFGVTGVSAGDAAIQLADAGKLFHVVLGANRIATWSGDGLGMINGTVKIKPKAGVPIDGDFTTPASGMIVLDTTNSRLYARVGTTWKHIPISAQAPPNYITNVFSVRRNLPDSATATLPQVADTLATLLDDMGANGAGNGILS